MKEDLKFLNSSRKSGLLGPQRPNYYMKSLEYYYQMEKNDYYSRLYKEHFQLSFNSMKFIKMINKTDADKFAVEGRLNLKKKIFYNSRIGHKQTRKPLFSIWMRRWCIVRKAWTWETQTSLSLFQTAKK